MGTGTSAHFYYKLGGIIVGGYLDIANSLGMWIMAIPVVLITGVQAIIFVKKSLDACKTKVVNLSKEQCKTAFRVGAVSAIGPALSVFIVMIALIAVIGGPMSWLRLSIIGAAPTELTAAQMGAEAMKVDFGGSDYDLTAFSSSVWVMTLNGCGWLLFCGLFTDKLGKLQDKVAGGDSKLMGVIASAAVLGTAGYLLSRHLLAGGPSFRAGIVSAIAMLVLEKVAHNKPKLKEYNLGIAMVIGMISAVVI
ncbi:MAG: DUF5058 family protein [Tissierellia bacterium]|nr:DUF5058 family protein [Tissierellia bacterium]